MSVHALFPVTGNPKFAFGAPLMQEVTLPANNFFELAELVIVVLVTENAHFWFIGYFAFRSGQVYLLI